MRQRVFFFADLPQVVLAGKINQSRKPTLEEMTAEIPSTSVSEASDIPGPHLLIFPRRPWGTVPSGCEIDEGPLIL